MNLIGKLSLLVILGITMGCSMKHITDSTNVSSYKEVNPPAYRTFYIYPEVEKDNLKTVYTITEMRD